MKVRTMIIDDDRFSCEFHAQACNHRKAQVLKQYEDRAEVESIEDLCIELERQYKADAIDGWGFWQENEITVSTESGSLFRVFPCIKF